MKSFIFPGKRTIKTAIAVLICLIVDALIFKTNGMYSSMAAVICMMPTTEETLLRSKQRMIGTVIGSAMGTIILYIYSFLPDYRIFIQIILIPILIIILIQLCNVFNLQSSIGLSSAIFIVLATSNTRSIDNVASYVVLRLLETFIGILAAYFVNAYIFPPKKSEEGRENSEENNKNNESSNL